MRPLEPLGPAVSEGTTLSGPVTPLPFRILSDLLARQFIAAVPSSTSSYEKNTNPHTRPCLLLL